MCSGSVRSADGAFQSVAQPAHFADHAPNPASVILPQAERVKGLYSNFTSEQALSYLDGSLPGDFGFDPLGLMDPEGAGGFVTPQWLAYR